MEEEEISISSDEWGIQIARESEHQCLGTLEISDLKQLKLLKDKCEEFLNGSM